MLKTITLANLIAFISNITILPHAQNSQAFSLSNNSLTTLRY